MYEQIEVRTVDPARARVYEHGWQSWGPSTDYPVTGSGLRPVKPVTQTMSYRPGKPGPERGFQGEGLLAVELGDGSTVVYGCADGITSVASIRAELSGDRLTVSADGPVDVQTHAGPMYQALAAWADGFAVRAGNGPIRPGPTAWCSWYHYFENVTEADIDENLRAITDAELPVDVLQIDDGWEAEIGDWLDLSDRFASLEALTKRIKEAGLRAGIWVAPFLAGSHSALVRDHPEWLIGHTAGEPADAGHNWDQDLSALDATHPGAAAYLRDTFGMLREAGFDYFKIDFLYAGALDGPRHSGAGPLDAYREGLRVIREAIGPESYLLGCGAPILPSVGLFDAMRVSADTAPKYEPWYGDPALPGQLGAALSTIGRAWQHGRFWVNDPDCLIVRPEVERREDWADVIERYGGLRVSSDRIASLDDWGMETTRRLLSDVPPPTPFP
ncbi:glycoside hydrolase family 36 protein [Planotetraspora sp. GP83]|uniref:glycoside hydrolase family 36 protein n=1 Tax=Planotetraspora sp. GP83 TaxID=3156264 RepID=UPI0035162687